MASAKQIAANRRNAIFSTGPRTDDGKLISSQNATQHGLTGLTVVRSFSQNDAYSSYHASMLPDLAPSTTFERDLADRVIHDCWLLHRAGVMNENLLYNGAYENRHGPLPPADTFDEDNALAEARAFRADAKTFNLLSLYTQRLERSVHKNLALLKSLQKERTQQPAAVRPALKAAPECHAQPINSATPPHDTGFVYSTPPAHPASPPQEDATTPETMAA